LETSTENPSNQRYAANCGHVGKSSCLRDLAVARAMNDRSQPAPSAEVRFLALTARS
jgi:hypothetical protein